MRRARFHHSNWRPQPIARCPFPSIEWLLRLHESAPTAKTRQAMERWRAGAGSE
ncbi:MAG TPA: hypothetical protein DIT64_07240 [Verrucomicrobiales bacterium]|nr:hypothetical protein [Verrucomicrobiales bacterium]